MRFQDLPLRLPSRKSQAFYGSVHIHMQYWVVFMESSVCCAQQKESWSISLLISTKYQGRSQNDNHSDCNGHGPLEQSKPDRDLPQRHCEGHQARESCKYPEHDQFPFMTKAPWMEDRSNVRQVMSFLQTRLFFCCYESWGGPISRCRSGLVLVGHSINRSPGWSHIVFWTCSRPSLVNALSVVNPSRCFVVPHWWPWQGLVSNITLSNQHRGLEVSAARAGERLICNIAFCDPRRRCIVTGCRPRAGLVCD